MLSCILPTQGPRVSKLRAAYASLFDAANSRLQVFPPDLRVEVAMWTFCAASHARLTKPQQQLTAETVVNPAEQLYVTCASTRLDARAPDHAVRKSSCWPATMDIL
eukprot:5211395-Pleurochrysis_carterae.AAC.1